MKPTLYQSRAIRCPTHTREPGGLTGCGYDNLYLAEDGAFKCGRCGLRFRPEDAEWSDNGEPVTPAPCSDNQPLHKHDRDCCAYLGRYEGEYLGRVHHDDLYYCNTPTGATVLARHSDEPSDYCSGMNFATEGLIPSLTEALRRAVDKGLCDPQGVSIEQLPDHLTRPFDVLNSNGWFHDRNMVHGNSYQLICTVEGVPDPAGAAKAISAVGELAQAANDAYEWLMDEQATNPGRGINHLVIKLRLALQKAGINPES